MMRFDLVSQQVQQFFIQSCRVVANVQQMVIIRCETGNINAIFKDLVFTAVILMVQVFANFKIMNLFVQADGDRVIIHERITGKTRNCLAEVLFKNFLYFLQVERL